MASRRATLTYDLNYINKLMAMGQQQWMGNRRLLFLDAGKCETSEKENQSPALKAKISD